MHLSCPFFTQHLASYARTSFDTRAWKKRELTLLARTTIRRSSGNCIRMEARGSTRKGNLDLVQSAEQASLLYFISQQRQESDVNSRMNAGRLQESNKSWPWSRDRIVFIDPSSSDRQDKHDPGTKDHWKERCVLSTFFSWQKAPFYLEGGKTMNCALWTEGARAFRFSPQDSTFWPRLTSFLSNLTHHPLANLFPPQSPCLFLFLTRSFSFSLSIPIYLPWFVFN